MLDIGCNAGFCTIELAKRGAMVTAMDYDSRYLEQARWAAGVFGLEDRIVFQQRDIYGLAHEPWNYDLIFFMGVFYHLRYPLLGLDIVARKVHQPLVFQTMTCPGQTDYVPPENLGLHERDQMNHPGWPKMAFIEQQLANDPTNWWAADDACLQAMLRSSGLRIISRPEHEIFICEPNRSQPFLNQDLRDAEYNAATFQSRKE